MNARIVVLLDSGGYDYGNYGPYLFTITDPNLTTTDAAARLTQAVEEVKERFPDEYDLEHLIAAKPDGLEFTEFALAGTEW